MPERFVYADHAATTPLHEEVREVMISCLTSQFGNPSSLHHPGREAKKILDAARQQVAEALCAHPKEIYFTSGGSEADNWAIQGVARTMAPLGKRHLITTAIEHHAVLHTMEALKKEGFSVTVLPVSEEGLLSPETLEAAIRPDTALVSVMYANNEIGTIQPIAEFGRVCRQHGVLFHTDAVQAVGQIPIDLSSAAIELLSLSGHKLYGPKGIGAVYVRRGTPLSPLIFGGGQEQGKRAGTENLPAIAGLGRAIGLACRDLPEKNRKISVLRDRLMTGLLAVPGCTRNGHPTKRLPGNVNVCFDAIEGEALVSVLDLQGICASTGSACNAGNTQPSHVLTAIGVDPRRAVGSLRLTLGEENSEADVDYILEVLPGIVARLRELSTEW